MEERTIDLLATQNIYAMATQVALQIFELSRSFPHGGPESIHHQIIEHSGAVCSYLAEAWQNRSNAQIFVDKLNEAAVQVAETQNQLEQAMEDAIIDDDTGERLKVSYDNINNKITGMIQELSVQG